MTAAVRSVSSTLLLLLLFTYVFAIVFKVQLGNTPEVAHMFRTIPSSMWTLFLTGTLLDDITRVLEQIQDASAVMCVVFLFFVVVAAIMMMNMLIGVLCEVIAAVAATEKHKLVVDFVRERLLTVLEDTDADGSRTISKDEFRRLIEDPRAQEALTELGVDCKHAVSLSDTLFETENENGELKSKSLGWGELLETVVELRADNAVSVAHV